LFPTNSGGANRILSCPTFGYEISSGERARIPIFKLCKFLNFWRRSGTVYSILYGWITGCGPSLHIHNADTYSTIQFKHFLAIHSPWSSKILHSNKCTVLGTLLFKIAVKRDQWMYLTLVFKCTFSSAETCYLTTKIY
jgi:hypothetical protein